MLCIPHRKGAGPSREMEPRSLSATSDSWFLSRTVALYHSTSPGDQSSTLRECRVWSYRSFSTLNRLRTPNLVYTCRLIEPDFTPRDPGESDVYYYVQLQQVHRSVNTQNHVGLETELP